MPALVAFGMKWRIGSDDLVFPYFFSLLLKLIWFLMTSVLVSFSGKHRCYEESVFKFYMYTLMCIQFLSCLVQLVIMFISGAGTIANPRPRRFIKWIIYLHTFIFVIEFLWESVGIVWVFDPALSCAASHFVLRMTRFILLWNVAISLITALIVLREVASTLCKAFDNYRGYVPSDLVAGLLLLKKKHKKQREMEKNRDFNLNLSKEMSDNNIEKIIHYYKFAMGSYGWMLYIYTKGFFGFLQLLASSFCSIFCRCCLKKEPAGLLQHTSIEGDNLLKWSTQSVLKWTKISKMNLIHAKFIRQAYCPAYIVAVDHIEKSVVIAIRGTLSVSDALVDLSAQPSLIMKKNNANYYAHQGMKDSTYSLHMKLEGEGMLQKIFNIYPSYRLIITGHSYGAGVAALLSMLLKPVYPNLHCYAFSPPGGLISDAGISFTKSFITSVVLGTDLIPRLSLDSFQFFSKELLHEIKTCKKPKFWIFVTSFVRLFGLKRKESSDTVQPLLGANEKIENERTGSREKLTEKNFKDEFDSSQSEEEICLTDSDGSVVNDTKEPAANSPSVPMPSKNRPRLYLPGRIIHIEREKQSAIKHCCCCCCKSSNTEARARWGQQSEFVHFLWDEDMVSDHLPSSLLEALESLKKESL
ncbi:PREDICTED: sn1-specific diacylglycerol lipase alpha-like [Amphimedon queenslandica]|uniref:sn-1-specific diacylglycerol lipase n=1 Tax=Amphimedon queenslandica TaxID=400682 RepID=A0AAN0IUJ5_AMPQE|nr:PREDICTED: sn1-specific diacylglycerol lipase alpha-like [Amphimedon queenslandica]|eukprot:XP_011410095.1 PREDICTED: sn1-specific diacylglycerol lipase alpha-like [Amphimedon queenslandica]